MFMKRIAELVMLALAQPHPVGQVEWTTPGTYQWRVPDNVYSISAVTVGGAGSGGVSTSSTSSGRAAYGPGLRYARTIPVMPGEVLTVIIGAAGPARAANSSTTPTVGGDTRIQRNGVDLLWAQGSQAAAGGGGSPIGGEIGGGNGGTGAKYSAELNEGIFNSGAGGAGGYDGDGGNGSALTTGGNPGAGGAGAGGRRTDGLVNGGRGGGVGLRGQGANGAPGGGGGSGGDGSAETGPVVGRATGSSTAASLQGTAGGARIIYGDGRFYPSTRTADE